jgi:cyclic-di-GMP phosphodiesterase TipF (flagellum assembly factor)
MVRVSAIFIAVCMVLIAVSVGLIAFLRFGFSGVEATLVSLGLLTALTVYNGITGRSRDRAEVGDQVTALLRSSSDLARQLAEFGRRLSATESKAEIALDRAAGSSQPVAAEIAELSALVKELADSVAAHDAALGGSRTFAAKTVMPTTEMAGAVPPYSAPAEAIAAAPLTPREIAAFTGLDKEGIVAAIRGAIEASRIDLYLQPIVSLPQRKVRYYEAMSRLKTESGDLVAAGDFLSFAEAGSLVPKLDNLSVLRCVQVVRRLLLKSRDIGLFCNLSPATLTDPSFPQFLEFLEANRAIAHALVFEFTQSAVRAMGPLEHEACAALAERGFRFSMDNLTDLRVEPRELNDRGFRFVKAPAMLLLNDGAAAKSDIHPEDFSDLLARFSIDLIAERIESEATVVDLLDYDVRFGQGFLFSPPRPVRAEALQVSPDAAKDPGTVETSKPVAAASEAAAGNGGLAAVAMVPLSNGSPERGGNFGHLVRAGGLGT